MASSFELLPKELKQQIADYLDDINDVGNLRLVCKDLCVNSGRIFATFFTTLRIFMHPLSLQNLLNTAASELLRDSVRNITISPHQLEPNPAPDVDGPYSVPSLTDQTQYDWHNVTEEQVDLWWDLLDEQDCMHNSGAASAMLLTAFSSFPRLQSLSICNDHPWGLRKITMLTGCHVETVGRPEFISRLFATCVDVLGRANVQLESLAVDLETTMDADPNSGLPIAALSPTHINLQQIPQTFKHLRSLKLTPAFHGAADIQSKALCKFLNQIPALHSLRLAYRRGESTRDTEYSLLHWLNHGDTPYLQDLHLQDISTKEPDLQAFLERHGPSLKRLSLHTVSLARKEEWQSLLRKIGEELRLESLHVDCPGCQGTSRWEEGERRLVWWKGMEWDSGRNEQVFEADMRLGLEEASGSVQYDFEV